MLAAGANAPGSLGRNHVYPDFRRIVHPDLVLIDACIETGCAKFAGDIFGGGTVLLAARDMRRGAQNAQVFLGKPRTGNGEEPLFELKLGGGIAEAADRRCRAGACLLRYARQRQQEAGEGA